MEAGGIPCVSRELNRKLVDIVRELTDTERYPRAITAATEPTLSGRCGRHSSANGYSRTTHTSAGPREVLCVCTGSNRSYTPNQCGLS